MKGSKLDEHRDEIIELIDMCVPKMKIAKKFSVNTASLYYFLNSRNIRFRLDDDAEKPKLQPFAERITESVYGSLYNEVYRLLNREMEGLEHQGLWSGNGHHAAQRMQAKVMETLKPLLKEIIYAEVLR